MEVGIGSVLVGASDAVAVEVADAVGVVVAGGGVIVAEGIAAGGTGAGPVPQAVRRRRRNINGKRMRRSMDFACFGRFIP